MIKAVIFDFDGTLADTLESIKHGINLTMDKFGYPHSTRDDVQAHINHGARNLIKLSLPLELQSDDQKIDEVYAVYNEMYKGVYLEVNSSGFRQGMDAPLPDDTVLSLYYALGGRMITVGSDSHTPNDIGADFEALEKYIKYGFTVFNPN